MIVTLVAELKVTLFVQNVVSGKSLSGEDDEKTEKNLSNLDHPGNLPDHPGFVYSNLFSEIKGSSDSL